PSGSSRGRACRRAGVRSCRWSSRWPPGRRAGRHATGRRPGRARTAEATRRRAPPGRALRRARAFASFPPGCRDPIAPAAALSRRVEAGATIRYLSMPTTEAHMGYDLEQFCAETRATLQSSDTLEAKLARVSDRLAALLANPAFVASAFADDALPGQRLLYRDEATDFHLLAHLQPGGQSRHAPH